MRLALALGYAFVLAAGLAIIEARSAATGVSTERQYTLPLLGWRLTLHEIDAGAVAYVAARNLSKNHRLRAEDLRRNPGLAKGAPVPPGAEQALVGNYLKEDVSARKPVKRDDVQGSPAAPTTWGRMPMFFALKDQDLLADILDVGWRVSVCRSGKKCVVRDAPVFAIVCPTSAGKRSCFVGVEVMNAEAREAGIDDAKTPLHVIPIAKRR